MRFAITVQFGGIVPSFMNKTEENHHQTPNKIEARHEKLLGLEPGLLILNEMVIYQDISLHVIGFTTWVVEL